MNEKPLNRNDAVTVTLTERGAEALNSRQERNLMVTTPDYKAGDEPSAVLDIAEHLRVAIKLLQQKKKSCPEGGVDLTIAQSHVIAAISCLMQSQHLDD